MALPELFHGRLASPSQGSIDDGLDFRPARRPADISPASPAAVAGAAERGHDARIVAASTRRRVSSRWASPLPERTDRLHRNFQGYTSDRADVLIGLGASAIGQLPQGYVQNAADVGSYACAIKAGHFATARGFELSREDRLRARIIERLMCDLQVDVDVEVRAEQGHAAQVRASHFRAKPRGNMEPPTSFADALAALDELADMGVVQRDGHRIYVTGAGRHSFASWRRRSTFTCRKDQKRHSVAV